MSTTTFEIEKEELGKFLTLAGERLDAGQPVPLMFSPAVDKAWHAMLGDPAYHGFCLKTAGQAIRHVAINGTGLVEWVPDYEKQWGKLPGIWFTDEYGTVNTTVRDQYEKTGDVVAEWNCGPAGGGGGDDDIAPKPSETATR